MQLQEWETEDEEDVVVYYVVPTIDPESKDFIWAVRSVELFLIPFGMEDSVYFSYKKASHEASRRNVLATMEKLKSDGR